MGSPMHLRSVVSWDTVLLTSAGLSPMFGGQLAAGVPGITGLPSICLLIFQWVRPCSVVGARRQTRVRPRAAWPWNCAFSPHCNLFAKTGHTSGPGYTVGNRLRGSGGSCKVTAQRLWAWGPSHGGHQCSRPPRGAPWTTGLSPLAMLALLPARILFLPRPHV